jgi:glycosyltransferase involved in cell wall biosynthesis
VKLLLITDAVGGVWVYSLELARALRTLGIEPVLAVMGPSPTPEQREAADGIKLIDTGLPLDWMPGTSADLRHAGEAIARLASREGADLVQTCSATLLADVHFDQPTIAVQHSCTASWWTAVRGTPLPAEFAWRRDLVARGLANACAIVAPSNEFATETNRIYAPPHVAVAIHNGRTPLAAAPTSQAAAVFTAGRLWDEGKNLATLDRAAAKLPIPIRAAGPTTGPNGAAASFANLDLLGPLNEPAIAAELAARPIFASAALYEPFGLSVLEAAQAGCALILSDIPTFRELWTDAAILLDARDAEASAAAIQHLLDNPAERARLGQAARHRSARYSVEAMGGHMAELYRQVLADQPTLQLAGAA